MIIKDILEEGRKLKVREDNARRAGEPPAYRVGNSGILVTTPKSDIVYGECARIAHLRYLGIDIVKGASTYEIFAEGETNELIVNDLFLHGVRALKLPYVVKREEEYPVKWTLDDGTPVTGRPDFVFLKDNKPVFGVELKKKVSYYSTKNSTFELKPDTKHLCQAAHYSWLLGKIPYYLVYRSGSVWHLDTADKKEMVEQSGVKTGVEYKGNRPFSVQPHYTIFELTWNDKDELVYSIEGRSTTTLITPDRIKAFYQASHGVGIHKALGPRPTSKHVGAKVDAGYSACTFCALKETCDSYEHDYDTWVDHVRIECDKSTQWTKGKDK